jgi:hypothetical protein
MEAKSRDSHIRGTESQAEHPKCAGAGHFSAGPNDIGLDISRVDCPVSRSCFVPNQRF